MGCETIAAGVHVKCRWQIHLVQGLIVRHGRKQAKKRTDLSVNGRACGCTGVYQERGEWEKNRSFEKVTESEAYFCWLWQKNKRWRIHRHKITIMFLSYRPSQSLLEDWQQKGDQCTKLTILHASVWRCRSRFCNTFATCFSCLPPRSVIYVFLCV